MPYIADPMARQELEPLCRRPAEDAAELCYQICRLVDRFLEAKDNPEREPVFGMRVGWNDLTDAEKACLKAAGELHDRFIRPYEDHMCMVNRDVFHPNLWGRGL